MSSESVFTMKILVTGAGGYLAEQLISRLSSEGHTVNALYRSGYRSELDKIPNVQLIHGDLMSKDTLYKAVEGCDEIYHVAAYAKSWAKDPKVFYEVNVGGTINLLDVAQELGVKRIAVTSTAGAIGPAPAGMLVTEDQYRRVDFFGDYESSKFIMNERILDYVLKGMDVRMVCPTRIFGPGNLDSKGSLMTQIFQKYLKGKWRIQLGSGQDRASYAFIDDVVEGHLLAMKNGKAGEKYLIGSFNDSFEGVMSTLARVSNKKYRLINVPFGVLNFYANLVGGIANMFSFDPVITKDWVRKLEQNWEADVSKAKKELGFVPTSEEEAIKKTVDWIKSVEK